MSHGYATVCPFSSLQRVFAEAQNHRQNSVEELFSLFKFLRVKPLNDWGTFNDTIAKPIKANKTTRPMKRLHVSVPTVCSTSSGC